MPPGVVEVGDIERFVMRGPRNRLPEEQAEPVWGSHSLSFAL
jgi:hypothetical protein